MYPSLTIGQQSGASLWLRMLDYRNHQIPCLSCCEKVHDYSNEGMIVLYREGLSNAHGNTE
jgi:hypothetical protein